MNTLKLEFVTDYAAHDAPGPFVQVRVGESAPYPLEPRHWEKMKAQIDTFFADPSK
jgi:hypothetical protein